MTGLASSSSDSDSDSGGSGSDSESDSDDEVEVQQSKQKQKPKQKKKKLLSREAPWGMAQDQNAKRDFLDRFSTERKIKDPSPAFESDDNMDNFIVEDDEEDENEYGQDEEKVLVDTRKRINMASDDESDASSQEEDETFEPDVKVGDSKKKAKKEREREKERVRAKERAKARKRSSGSDSGTKRRKVVMVGSDDDDDTDDDVDDERNDHNSDSREEMSGPAMYWQVDAMLDQKEEELTRARGHSKRHHSRKEAMHLYLEMLARAHVQKDFSMDDAEAYKYAGAVKQIEDIICTTRESLLGSGAWNREYTQHMQTRPFFTVAFKEEDRDMVPCAACHRKSKWLANGSEPPIRTVAYMYGTEYDARRVWNSARWPEYMPQDVFMWRSGEKLRLKNRKLRQQRRKKQQTDEDDARSGSETDDSSIIEILPRNKSKGEGEDSSQLENMESESEPDGALEDSASDDSGLDEEDEEELEAAKWWLRKWPQDLLSGKDKKFFLGGACTSRSQMYHNLLHYKFRLLYRVRGKLEAYKSDVDALMSDLKFVKAETSRFARMLDLAGRRYGGAEQVNGISGTDIWNDAERNVYTASETPAPNQGHRSTPMCMPSALSSSSSSSRVLSTTQITQWLVRK